MVKVQLCCCCTYKKLMLRKLTCEDHSMIYLTQFLCVLSRHRTKWIPKLYTLMQNKTCCFFLKNTKHFTLNVVYQRDHYYYSIVVTYCSTYFKKIALVTSNGNC